MRSSKLSLFCERALEAGWLIGVTITPVFFNVYSSRVFEPDKLTTLRALATVMAIVWLVRFLDERLHGSAEPLRFSWRTPLVWPALATMAVYVITSLLSLTPYTSFVGSYQRLQGTYSWFGYLVIFFAILTSLRTRAQLSRLITVLILNSLPVALYGIVQHEGLDPLPWAGDVQTRVASNMGNAIFVAAYLIMIAPLTVARIIESFGDILRREKARVTDILRASGYIFIFVVQILTTVYSKSRGPFLGIGVAGLLLPYLLLILLQRQAAAAAADERARGEEAAAESKAAGKWGLDLLYGVALGVGSLAGAGLLAAPLILLIPGNLGALLGGGLALLAFGGIWLYFIVERIGWRWLWMGWAVVGMAAAAVLLVINVPGPLQDMAQQVPTISRMTRILQWESGSGKVRTLIWEGAMELVSPHEPIAFPDGSEDTFNAIRPLVGYGPESMYVAYNSFYPPELGHYESRTASPDRSHNETLDAVVITGALGAIVYLVLFGAVFYWGLRWLGLLTTRGQAWLYFGLIAAISLGLAIFFAVIGRFYFFAVAIPIGFVVGTALYMTWYALRLRVRGRQIVAGEIVLHSHSTLLAALLMAILGHFVEINFGIAIAATRTTFWAFVGLLVVLGLEWLPALVSPAAEAANGMSKPTAKSGQNAHRSRSARRRVARAASESWGPAVVALSLMAVFLLGTLAYDFINNPNRSTDPGAIMWRSLTVISSKDLASPGGLVIVVFSGAIFGVIGLSEYHREGLLEVRDPREWWNIALTFVGIAFFGFLIFAGILAGVQALLPQIPVQTVEDVVAVAETLANVLGRYYGLIFVSLIAIGLILMWESDLPKSWGHTASWVVFLVLLVLSVPLIGRYCYDLIRADIIYKQGGAFANNSDATQRQIGIAHYERAIELAPREDYYFLFLGKAYLELAQTPSELITDTQRAEVFRTTESVLLEAREINPLNTDHSANLARFYRSWAARVGEGSRNALLGLAEDNYLMALVLSPNNPILWNELAILYAFDLDAMENYQMAVDQSLALDTEYEQTWSLIADVRANREQDIPGAIAAYEQSLEIKPKDCTVRRALGVLQTQQSLWTDSIENLEATIGYCPTMSELWDIYRMLAIAYYYEGQQATAVQTAQTALTLAPESQKAVVEQLLAAIQPQGETPDIQEP